MKKNQLLAVSLFLIFVALPFQSCKKVEDVKNDMLEYSLNALGDKLFSVTNNGSEKNSLKEKYDQFVQRATNGEASKEQIEYVAANILNASNSQDTINNDLANALVEATDPSFDPKSSSSESQAPELNTPLSEEQRLSIGEDLAKTMDFNEKLKEKYNAKKDKESFSKIVFYEFDKGLVLNLDEKLKTEWSQSDFEIIEEELSEISKIHRMEWKKDLFSELEREHELYRKDMKKLMTMQFENPDLHELSNIPEITFYDSNFYSPSVPHVNMDSIMQMVQKQLEAAGVSQEIIIKN